MFNLVIPYYNSNNKDRQLELDTCLIKNANNPNIKKIYLMTDNIYELDFINIDVKNKIKQILVDDDNKKRMSFSYIFNFTNKYLKNEKCIVANTDIYFDNSLSLLLNYNLDKTFISLTKYEIKNSIPQLSIGWDSWIFQSPINLDLDIINFKFGIPLCDNRLMAEAINSGYNVINPSLTIKSYHLHESNYRTYN